MMMELAPAPPREVLLGAAAANGKIIYGGQAVHGLIADVAGSGVTAAAFVEKPAAERKLHVLLVEDDHATLVFVKALLRSCGHEVTTATNGREAIHALIAPTVAVDLILTDIMMPEVDGMELMKIVQSMANNTHFKTIPIVVMSTVYTDEIASACHGARRTTSSSPSSARR